ncbi:50S ribosomal protein L21 [Candidatus Cytomitobacter primus]|uniref:Large ribosomal subunit protein bL21 n=1 Tax=Candidatus Cytomitobacter primus TaxID=2066024 RepID=A0A5C0UGL1_9PROT|nr:50S ribosomal protein L21 [Candidatus Cytomitobacter primus]QEK38432.1 50S ribosomal protein L21 [Candidatus Cytomitobacter primus]
MLSAVVQSGGHQYIVSEGSFIKHATLDSDIGSSIELNNLGCLGKNDQACVVKAEVIKHGRDKKVIIFKKIRRHNHRKFNTHRQGYTLLRVTKIETKE